MTKTDIRELRTMEAQELVDLLEDKKEAFFNLRFQKASGQLEDMNVMRYARREIARIKMVLRERQIAAQIAREESTDA